MAEIPAEVPSEVPAEIPAEIELIRGDITKVAVDVIVNAANSGLLGGGGVDGAIHRAAGPELLAECRGIAGRRKGMPDGACPTGEAVLTGAYRLPCKGVIHTVGPVWQDGEAGEAALLASCYRKSILIAAEEGFESLAFPNISTGVYGYPREEAAVIAITAVRDALRERPGIKRVVFVCFDEENYRIYQRLLPGSSRDSSQGFGPGPRQAPPGPRGSPPQFFQAPPGGSGEAPGS